MHVLVVTGLSRLWPRWDGGFVAYSGPKWVAPVIEPDLLEIEPYDHHYYQEGRPFSVQTGEEGGQRKRFLCSPVQFSQKCDAQTTAWRADNTAHVETGRSLLSAEEARVLGAHWAVSAQHEHASVASFARHTLELMAVGAPASILKRAQQAGVEEVGHAQLCFALAQSYGVTARPGPFPLPSSSSSPSLLEMATKVAIEGCVGEFASCLIASLQAARAVPDFLKTTLKQIAREELGHCVLAWNTLRWAALSLSKEESAQLARSVEEALETERTALMNATSEPEGEARVLEDLSIRLPGMGLLPRKEQMQIRLVLAQQVTLPWVSGVLQQVPPCLPAVSLEPILTQVLETIHADVFQHN